MRTLWSKETNNRPDRATLLAAGAVLLLAGCAPMWSLPGQAAAVLAALGIAWGIAAAGRMGEARGQPLSRQEQPAETVHEALNGDGTGVAALAVWLSRNMPEWQRQAGDYTVFESVPLIDTPPRSSASPRSGPPRARGGHGPKARGGVVPDNQKRFDPAGASLARTADLTEADIRGDGFSGPAGIVLAADRQKLNPVEGNLEAIDRGGVLFNTRCGTYCHGGQAIGGGCPSLVDEFWLHGDSDIEIYKVIAGGGGPGTRMGAFGGELSTEQIWDVIAYLRHRGKEYLLEKAGPRSYRQKGAQCPNELFLSLTLAGGRALEGLLKIEDKESVTVEDRSGTLPTQFRVMKERILDGKVKCVE